MHRLIGLDYDPPTMIRLAPLRPSAACVGAALLLNLACASQSDATQKRVSELENHLRRIQATSDRLEERIVAVETSMRASTGPARSPGASTDLTRPDLPVVQVAPTTSPPPPTEAPPPDEESRPLIVGEGSRVETRSAGAVTAVASEPSRTSAGKGKGSKREGKAATPERRAP